MPGLFLTHTPGFVRVLKFLKNPDFLVRPLKTLEKSWFFQKPVKMLEKSWKLKICRTKIFQPGATNVPDCNRASDTLPYYHDYTMLHHHHRTCTMYHTCIMIIVIYYVAQSSSSCSMFSSNSLRLTAEVETSCVFTMF